jgi:hypothetical protein
VGGFLHLEAESTFFESALVLLSVEKAVEIEVGLEGEDV